MSTPTLPSEEAACKRLVTTGRKLIALCNEESPNIASIATTVIHQDVISAIKGRDGINAHNLYITVYDECRDRKDRHRQPTSPSDDPTSEHSKATYLAVYGFADMVMESLGGFNPLIQDGSEESLSDYHRDLMCIANCLVNLHRMQIHADKNMEKLHGKMAGATT